MLDVKEIPVPQAAKHFTELQYIILADEETIFELGMKVYDLLQRRTYIWVQPVGDIRAIKLREFRKLLHVFDGITLFANIDIDDLRAQRFAEFFGFRHIQTVDQLALYERNS